MKKPWNERYEACFRLFLRHNGKNFCLIEREMRALGYGDFNRRILYSRKEKGVYKPGWIERFGWHAFLDAETKGRGDAGIHDHTSPVHPGPVAPRPAVPVSPRLPVPASQLEFKAWLKSVSPGMTWNWKHQEYIYRHLERVTSGESKRLMIFLPPRHGKSELVTVRYAGWRLWNDPKMRIIVSSYNQRLADKFSRSIRRLLSEEEDKLLRTAECGVRSDEEGVRTADCGLRNEEGPSASSDTRAPQCTCDPSRREDSALRTPQSAIPQRMFPPSRKINSASQWETAVGGGVKAVGVGAGVTGFGAQLIIIDDPVKNRAEAESETLREKVWDGTETIFTHGSNQMLRSS